MHRSAVLAYVVVRYLFGEWAGVLGGGGDNGGGPEIERRP